MSTSSSSARTPRGSTPAWNTWSLPAWSRTLRIITHGAAERIVRYAFELARWQGRRRVTFCHKADVLPLSDGLFLKTAREVADDYPFLEFEEMHVDRLCMQLALDPSRFDVLVMENLFGDVISDLCAGLVGGLGLVPGSNLGAKYAVFEAVHGSAPDIAGQGLANPIALLRSAALMLLHIGQRRPAERIEQSVRRTLEAARRPDTRPGRRREHGEHHGAAGAQPLLRLARAIPSSGATLGLSAALQCPTGPGRSPAEARAGGRRAMDYDDDYEDDFPARRRPRGVSGGWRVAAVISFVLLAVCGLMLLAALVELLDRPSAPPGPVGPPAWLGAGPPQPPPVAADVDPEDQPEPAVPPYPLVQDLRPAGTFPPVPGEPAAEADAHDQFLRAGEVIWTSPEPFGPERVLASPDGTRIAYAGSQGVMVGPPQALRLLEGTQPRHGPNPQGLPEARAVVCSWFPNSAAISLTGTDGSANVVRVGPFDRRFLEPMAGAAGSFAVPVPPGQEQIVLIRHRSRPKIESGSRQYSADPSEVVLFTPGRRTTRILIAAGAAVWRTPAVSPEGKRLALVSDSGQETTLPQLWRVFVLDLAGGVPKPLSPPAPRVGSVCWAADGKTLVYDRAALVSGDDSLPGEGYRTNLFELDAATGRETPLTHGGGFSSPSLGSGDDLFCLVQTQDKGQFRTELLRLPRARARELTATRLAGRRNGREWLELAAAVLQDAGLPADATVRTLDEEKVKKLAAAFATALRRASTGSCRRQRPDWTGCGPRSAS